MLAGRARVSLLAFVHAGESSAISENFYEQVITVKRDSGYTFAKLVRGAVSQTPLPLLNYTTDAMRQALKHVLAGSDFDIVQLESIHLMGYLPVLRAAPKRPLVMCDWHNIESELMSRYAEHEGSSLRRMYARRTAKLMRQFEQRALTELDGHVTVSERDAERLHRLNPKARIFVIENGVDASHYSDEQLNRAYEDWQQASVSPIRNKIIFVGSMDYHANIDAVLSFSREVWPKLREQEPGLLFSIVGRDPPAEVRELVSIQGIEVTGTVDDVRPYYRDAVAAVVPLKVGGGSRLKILEAMAAGVPVVSTTLGAEGLKVQHQENILLADSGEQMTKAIVSLHKNPEQRRHLSEAGRAMVTRQYDWSQLGSSLFDVYQHLLGV